MIADNTVLDFVYLVTSTEEFDRLRALASSFGDVTVSGVINGAAYVYMPAASNRAAALAADGFVLYSMAEWVEQMQAQRASAAGAPAPAASAPVPPTPPSTGGGTPVGFVGVATRVVHLGSPAGAHPARPAPVSDKPSIPPKEVLEAYIEALPTTVPTTNHGVLSLPLGVYRWMREADGFHVAWHPVLSDGHKGNGEHLGPFTGHKHAGWQALIAAVVLHAQGKSGYYTSPTNDLPVELAGTPVLATTATASSASHTGGDAGAAEYDDADDQAPSAS